ncbi:substrate-binding domain-containing protein, partial [Marinobacterium sedimentorum]|uniref:substrate-binding domain-containing protein n=1 Tax=Marinobacterium sedimentorum TaxID=2927804 RepID=UPI0020C5D7FA
ARHLATGRSGLVAMIIQEGTELDLSAGSFLGTFNEKLSEQKLDLVVRMSTRRDGVEQYSRFAARSFVDCIIINGPHVNDKRITLLQQSDAKFVVHGRDLSHKYYAYYDIDNFGAVEQATRYLLDLGHRRIALFINNPDLAYVKCRVDGYQSAMHERLGPNHPGIVLEDVEQSHFGYAAIKDLLARPDRPTAIYCGNGVFRAIGVYRAARELGLKIGRDLSVIAHDDVISTWQSTKFDPPLTVTRKPVNDACSYLVKAVVGVIEGKQIEELQFVDKVDLVVRGSTGPCLLS